PSVSLAPALILRKRSGKPIRRMFKDILSLLKSGMKVPEGLTRFLDSAPNHNAASPLPAAASKSYADTEELYFPLAANKEQRTIAERLFQDPQLLVHGPPGTGKSHTIVNLICHLLATGKRVLVTSHTFRALKIIEKKCPAGIKDLCIFLLGDDLR